MLDGEAEYVEDVAPEIGEPNAVHAPAVFPEYHWYVLPPDPPEGFAVSVTDCPLSMIRDVGVGVPAVNVELVVTVADAGDVAVSDAVALSVTCSSNV